MFNGCKDNTANDYVQLFLRKKQVFFAIG